MRIVSLLPSATEMVCLLGLEDSLVGVTHECDVPASVLNLPKVTGTLIPEDATSAEIDALVRERMAAERALYTLDADMLDRLQPDVIITQKLCDVCAVAEDEVRSAVTRLQGRPIVVNLEPQTLNEVFGAIEQIAQACNRVTQGQGVVAGLRRRVETIASRSAKLNTKNVAFLEWLDPPFSAGHWNPELIALAGGVDLLGEAGRHSRTLEWDEVVQTKPEVLFIACCGFHVARAMEDVYRLPERPDWSTLPAVQGDQVWISDGSLFFNRPGPRLVESLEILAHAIHPEHHDVPEQPAIRATFAKPMAFGR